MCQEPKKKFSAEKLWNFARVIVTCYRLRPRLEGATFWRTFSCSRTSPSPESQTMLDVNSTWYFWETLSEISTRDAQVAKVYCSKHSKACGLRLTSREGFEFMQKSVIVFQLVHSLCQRNKWKFHIQSAPSSAFIACNPDLRWMFFSLRPFSGS